jgi:hypothetical protein
MEERRCKRQLENDSKRRKEGERVVRPTDGDCKNFSDIAGTSTDSNDSIATEDEDISTTKSFAKTPKRIKTVGSTNIIRPAVASALDRTKVSDRNATFIVAAVAKSLGHDPSELVLNKESVRNARRQNRTSTARMVKESFCLDGPPGPLTVHWDGKILPALTGKDSVDRLAVIVLGDGIMKLLGIPKILSVWHAGIMSMS